MYTELFVRIRKRRPASCSALDEAIGAGDHALLVHEHAVHVDQVVLDDALVGHAREASFSAYAAGSRAQSSYRAE